MASLTPLIQKNHNLKTKKQRDQRKWQGIREEKGIRHTNWEENEIRKRNSLMRIGEENSSRKEMDSFYPEMGGLIIDRTN
jgi:hypothetical protein